MTHAIFLAAGSGTRLRPYTDEKSKCSYAGHSLIHHQLEALRRNGVTDITVGGYKYECLEQLGVNLVVNEHYATTNMVSTLFCARTISMMIHSSAIPTSSIRPSHQHATQEQ